MKTIITPIPDALVFEPRVFGDQRGFFLETYQAERYRAAGIKENFVQDNHSHSSKGVLRGLHFQKQHPQGKLVQVSQGVVFDVAVDLRPDSPAFGQWYGVILDTKTHKQFYVPPGCAHGFCVLSEEADFHYKCTDYYHAEDEGCLLWNDADIGIEWPLDIAPELSAKDQVGDSWQNLKQQLLG